MCDNAYSEVTCLITKIGLPNTFIHTMNLEIIIHAVTLTGQRCVPRRMNRTFKARLFLNPTGDDSCTSHDVCECDL